MARPPSWIRRNGLLPASAIAIAIAATLPALATAATNATAAAANATSRSPSVASSLGPFTREALEYADAYAAAAGHSDPSVVAVNKLAALYHYLRRDIEGCSGGDNRQSSSSSSSSSSSTLGDDPPPSPTAVPVVTIPPECTEVCADLVFPFPARFSMLCAECVVAFPALPSWPHELNFGPVDPIFKVNEPLARMPLSEVGYSAMPSIPLLFPKRYLGFGVRALGATDYLLQATDQSNTNDIWAGGVRDPEAAWTINGKTLPMLSTTHARVPQNCVLQQGWITPPAMPACPGTPEFDWESSDAPFPSLAAAAEAIPLPYGGSASYRRIAAAQIADAFSSPEGAARAVFDSMQAAYGTVLFLKNVTRESAPDRLAQLQELYGPDEWQSVWTAAAERGDLVEVDLTYTQGMQSSVPTGPWWNVAAHALFEARTVTGRQCKKQMMTREVKEKKDGSSKAAASAAAGDKDPKEEEEDAEEQQQRHGKGGGGASSSPTCTSLLPVAIRLSNQPGNVAAAPVYTPAKSPTAYVAAAVALRAAVDQTNIWIGHVFNLHISTASATLSLYNRVDPTNAPYYSTSPLRQIADWFADPTYVSEFHAFLFVSGYVGGPGTAVGVPDLLQLWELWTQRTGANWANNMMAAQLVASGLSESRFRGQGRPGSWDGLPGASYQLKLRKIAGAYATAFVNAAYADDGAVANDAAIQAMAATLCAADGSNLVALRVPSGDDDDGCALDTRARLANFVGDWLSLVSAHSSAHLQDFVLRIMNMPLSPPRLGRQDAPDPNGVYAEADYLTWVPSTGTMARQVFFFANFIATSWTYPVTNMVPSQQWQKGDVPVWNTDLPLYTGPNPSAVNAAHVAYIRAVARLYETAPRAAGFRDVATNYQNPTRAPRVINI